MKIKRMVQVALRSFTFWLALFSLPGVCSVRWFAAHLGCSLVLGGLFDGLRVSVRAFAKRGAVR